MKLPKALSLIPFAFGSILSVSASEYKFDSIKFDQVKNEQNIYEPRDKIDELPSLSIEITFPASSFRFSRRFAPICFVFV